MNTSSSDGQAKILISGLLCFALGMLLIAAFRVSDPVVGERWQRFIELVLTLMGIGLFFLGVFYVQKARRERQLIRQHYAEMSSEKAEVPVTPASFTLTQSSTRPS